MGSEHLQAVAIHTQSLRTDCFFPRSHGAVPALWIDMDGCDYDNDAFEERFAGDVARPPAASDM